MENNQMIFESITAFCSAVSESAKTMKTAIEHRLELRAVKEDDRQEKAIKAANKAFDLILLYLDYLPKEVRKQFQKFKKTFDNNIT